MDEAVEKGCPRDVSSLGSHPAPTGLHFLLSALGILCAMLKATLNVVFLGRKYRTARRRIKILIKEA